MSLAIPVGKDDHVLGPADAPVTLVEYGDYQCPACGAAHPMVKVILKRLGAKLRFVFRHMPLSEMHPYAELAAEAAEAAAAQGKFWEMHNALYEHQDELGPDLVTTLAKRLRLDTSRFEDDLVSGRFRDHVKRDFMGGVRSGVNGTPTFFVDGMRYDGILDEPSLEAVLRQRIAHNAYAAAGR
jgi:protein-disulfide isomerase